MAKDLTPVDISNMPELLRLAEEVRKTEQPCVLRSDSEDLAILMPAKPSSRRKLKRAKTKADHEAFLSSAGSWKELVDTDKLIQDIYDSRSQSSRPPVEL